MCRLQETEFKVDVTEYLGPLLFVKIRKRHFLQNDAWFCNWISVQGPGASGDEFRFPCYRWVEGSGILSLPEGTGEHRVGCEEASGAQEKLGVEEGRRGNGVGAETLGGSFGLAEEAGSWSWHAATWRLRRGVMLKGQAPLPRIR